MIFVDASQPSDMTDDEAEELRAEARRILDDRVDLFPFARLALAAAEMDDRAAFADAIGRLIAHAGLPLDRRSIAIGYLYLADLAADLRRGRSGGVS